MPRKLGPAPSCFICWFLIFVFLVSQFAHFAFLVSRFAHFAFLAFLVGAFCILGNSWFCDLGTFAALSRHFQKVRKPRMPGMRFVIKTVTLAFLVNGPKTRSRHFRGTFAKVPRSENHELPRMQNAPTKNAKNAKCPTTNYAELKCAE